MFGGSKFHSPHDSDDNQRETTSSGNREILVTVVRTGRADHGAAA
jgi:hypothetical protein